MVTHFSLGMWAREQASDYDTTERIWNGLRPLLQCMFGGGLCMCIGRDYRWYLYYNYNRYVHDKSGVSIYPIPGEIT